MYKQQQKKVYAANISPGQPNVDAENTDWQLIL